MTYYLNLIHIFQLSGVDKLSSEDSLHEFNKLVKYLDAAIINKSTILFSSLYCITPDSVQIDRLSNNFNPFGF